MKALSPADAKRLAQQRLARLDLIEKRFGARLAPNGVKLLRRAAFEAFLTLRNLELPTDDGPFVGESWR